MKQGVAIAMLLVIIVAGVVYIARPQTLEERVTSTTGQPTSDIKENIETSLSKGVRLAVPDFEALTTSGETVKLSELVAQKPTMIGFWASWCPNCQRNLPAQAELFKKYKDEINLVEVNLRESKSDVDKYLSTKDFEFIVAYDESGALSQEWGIQYTNTHILIAGDGSVLRAFPGDVTEQHFIELAATAR